MATRCPSISPKTAKAWARTSSARINREEFSDALEEAKTIKNRPVCIVTETDRRQRVAGYESWWDVPVAEVSESESVDAARRDYEDYKKRESYYQ